jgi:hypothetical protein
MIGRATSLRAWRRFRRLKTRWIRDRDECERRESSEVEMKSLWSLMRVGTMGGMGGQSVLRKRLNRERAGWGVMEVVVMGWRGEVVWLWS